MVTETELAMMDKVDAIDYWTDLIQEDLGVFTDIDRVKKMVFMLRDSGQLKWFTEQVDDNDTGVFAYLVTDDLKGGKCLAELIFYIKPQYRGDIKLVKRYIQRAESIARDKYCICVKIGSNIEYKDKSFIKLLKRWGYVDDTVSKTL